MARETIYMAQSFRVDGRKLVAGTPEKHRTKEAAVASATRMAAAKAGAVAFEVSGDPDGGDYDEPVVLFKAGRLPKEFDES